MKKKICLIFAIVLVALTLLCSCGGSEYAGLLESDGGSTVNKSVISGDTVDVPEQKYVITSSMTIETKNFKEDIKKINGWISELSGYVETLTEDLNPSNDGLFSDCRMTVRIPVENLGKFQSDIESTGCVTYKTENKENITDSYYEAESYFNSLKVREERLLAIMETATTLDEIIKLEESLADIRQKISYYETLLKTYDNQVEYATINLTIRSVATYTENETFGSRFADAFVSSWIDFWDGCKEFVIWFVSAVPTLLVLGVIGLAIFLIVTGIVRKSKKKRAKKNEANGTN